MKKWIIIGTLSVLGTIFCKTEKANSFIKENITKERKEVEKKNPPLSNFFPRYDKMVFVEFWYGGLYQLWLLCYEGTMSVDVGSSLSLKSLSLLFSELCWLKYEYQFKRSELGVGVIELFPPLYGYKYGLWVIGSSVCIGIVPIDFSVKVGKGFYFKIKTNMYSFLPRMGDWGILFFWRTDERVNLWRVRIAIEEKFNFKIWDKTLTISPGVRCYGKGEFSGDMVLKIVTVGINISVGRRRK